MPRQRGRALPAAVGLLLVGFFAIEALLLVTLATPAHAQGAPPAASPASPVAAATPEPPSGPSAPSAGDIAGAVVGGLTGALPGLIEQAISNWFTTSGPGMFGKLITAGFGLLAEVLWNVAGGLLGGVNIFTQLPPAWSYGLGPVALMQSRLAPVARAVLGGAIVLGIAWAGIGTILGRPFGRLLNALPTVLLAAGGLLFAPALMRGWIDFANAASAMLLDPDSGLPGLGAVQGYDRMSALGVVAVVYLVVAFLLLLHRIKLVVLASLLLIVAPLAIAVGALPFAQAQRFFGWWLATFVGVTFVQVLQAACLGLGGALLASPAITGQYSGPAEGMMSAGLGIGAILAAMSLPNMLLGSLARANLAPGALSTALSVATMVSGFGLLGPLQAGRATVRPWATPPLGAPASAGMASIRPLGSGYVRSLLGESVPLLPPPKP